MPRSIPREWQFSLRSLLIATTVASICLALGTIFVGIVFFALVVVLIQAATLLSVDWLIRPANRQVLAFVTAGSWMLSGSGLVAIGLKMTYEQIAIGKPIEMWAAIALLGLAALFCYGFGWHRWRQLTAYRRANL